MGSRPSKIEIIPIFISEEEETQIIRRLSPVVRRMDYGDGRIRVNRRFQLECAWLSERIRSAFGATVHKAQVMEMFPGQGLELHSDILTQTGRTFVVNIGMDAVQKWAPIVKVPPTYLDPRVSYEGEFTLDFPRRSLLVFSGDAYYLWSHGVMPSDGLRHSLTWWG
jgi:hypothetical protein